MNEEIIYKYLDGTTTEEEKKILLEWIEDSAENRYFFFEIRAIWNAKDQLQKEQAEEQANISLQKLNQKIDQAEKVNESKNIHLLKRRIGAWISCAAVITLLIFFSISHYRNTDIPTNGNNELLTFTNTSVDSVQIIRLSDGSEVWLNENSTLRYPESFSGNNRTVYLKGEAFFEVATDPVIPFIVKTEATQIKVLGTSFSVSTHFADQTNEVILTSGSVQLQRLDGTSLINLQPGQKALYSKESETVEIDEVDLDTLSSWKYGLLSLSNVSVETILEYLENTYHTPIMMETSSLTDRRYHFSFKRSKGIHEALKQLSFMTGVPAQVAMGE